MRRAAPPPPPPPPPPRPAARARAAVGLGRSFTHRLHTLHKLTGAISQAAYLAEAGMTLGEGRCLAAIGAFAPLSVNDLAQAANLNKGQASRSAQSLVDQGLVHKDASTVDGRGVVLRLTPAGERSWRCVMAVIEARNEQILACLSAGERALLDGLLDRLVAHARDAAGGGGAEAAGGDEAGTPSPR
jgi:DNA-binding MarR family transcriptional regulator